MHAADGSGEVAWPADELFSRTKVQVLSAGMPRSGPSRPQKIAAGTRISRQRRTPAMSGLGSPAIRSAFMDGMAEWQSRPLDPVYAVIYLALGVTAGGGREVLGLWALTVVIERLLAPYERQLQQAGSMPG